MRRNTAETRQLDFLNRAIDYTHDRLRVPRLQDALGDASLRLLTVVESFQAVPSTTRGIHHTLHTIPGYESTETIPVTIMQQGDYLHSSMGNATPLQQQRATAREWAPYAYEYDSNDPALDCIFDVGMAVTAYSAIGAYEDQVQHASGGGMATSGRREHVPIYRYRPHIALHGTMQKLPLNQVAPYIAHEAAHADLLLRNPITIETNEDDSLRTELYAYWVQHALTQALLTKRQQHTNKLPSVVESVRHSVNGPALGNPAAFEPNQAVKSALAAKNASYSYL